MDMVIANQPADLRGPETFSTDELIGLGCECYSRMLAEDTNSSISLSVWMRIVVRLAVRGISGTEDSATRIPYDDMLQRYILEDIEQR
jgi:hypothetical protein